MTKPKAKTAAPKPTQAKAQKPASTKSKPRGTAVPAERSAPRTTKLDILISLLTRAQGMTIAQASVATGWQAHSVRGALAGSIKKKLGHQVTSEKSDGDRIYRIAPKAQ